MLANIFNLNAIRRSPNQEINRVDELILDFHAMNYDFCSKQQFSNEKVSTMLALFNWLLHTMVKHQLVPEQGQKLLKQILEKHSIQRPPFSIFIYTREEIDAIIDFALKTFFRHFSLYEYSFKPKVDLLLMTLPKELTMERNETKEEEPAIDEMDELAEDAEM